MVTFLIGWRKYVDGHAVRYENELVQRKTWIQRSDTHVSVFVSWLESVGSCVHWVASYQRAVASVLRNCASSDLLPVLQKLLEVRI